MQLPPGEDGSSWRKPSKEARQNGTIVLLLLAIMFFEWQRVDAQAKAHRERQEQSTKLAEIDLKLNWLLFTSPPMPSATKPRPAPAPLGPDR